MKVLTHPVSPVYDRYSKILLLGSFPSVKSREDKFFYAHPQNRFWKVVAAVFNSPVPETIDDKKYFLLENHIALWDVIASCEVCGSSDSSIKNVVPTNLTPILESADIKEIFVNGRAAHKFYRKYTEPVINRKAVYLPSTSPANAAWSLERLIEDWSIIKV